MKPSFLRFGTVVTALFLVAGVVIPSVSHAQSVAELQQQIQSLLSQIKQLQTQLAAQIGNTAPSFCHTFTTNLGIGERGAQVQALQIALNKEGLLDPNFEGLSGSPGKSVFDETTASAVTAFQEKYRSEILDPAGLKYGTGYVGRLTRAKLNQLYGCGTRPTPPPTPVPPGTPPPPPNPNLLNILYPNGGETLQTGATQTIQWTLSPIVGSMINISLIPYSPVPPCTTVFCPSMSPYRPYTIQNDVANTGSYAWLVGDVIDYNGARIVVPDGAYTVMICDTASQRICDSSDSYFKITSSGVGSNGSPKITHVAPLPSNVQPGQTAYFTWIATDPDNDDLSWFVDWGDNTVLGTPSCKTNPSQNGANWTHYAKHAWANAGTYTVKATVTDCRGGKDMNSFTIPVGSSTTQIPSVRLYGSSGNQISDASIWVNMGNTFTISGTPQGLQGLSYWTGSGSPPPGYYNMAYFFDQNFGNNNVCGNNAVTVTGPWTMTCTAKVSGSSNFYVEIYANGQTYRSNSVYVTIPSGPSINTFTASPSTINSGETVTFNFTGHNITTYTFGLACAPGVSAPYSYSPQYPTDTFGELCNTTRTLYPTNTSYAVRFVNTTGAPQVSVTLTATWSGGGVTAKDEKSIVVNVLGTTSRTQILTVTKNAAFGNPTYPAGTATARVGSYALTAPSKEGVQLTYITLKAGSMVAGQFQNLKIMNGSTQFGTTKAGSLANDFSYTFSGNLSIPAGQTVYLDAYADVLPSATSGLKPAVTSVADCSSVGSMSATMFQCGNVPVAGQDVTISSQSSPILTLSIDPATPPARQIAMGTTGNALAAFRIAETSNVEDVRVTDLIISDTVSPTLAKSSFSNLAVYSGTTGSSLGTASSYPVGGGGGYAYTIHFTTPLLIPRSGLVTLALKGDVASYSSSGATDNSVHSFALSGITATGVSSNVPPSLHSLPPNVGNPMTVLRTVLGASTGLLGTIVGRIKTPVDDVGTITLSADPAGSLVLNAVTVTFSGTAPMHPSFLNSVNLYDPAIGSNVGFNSTFSTACTGTNSCSKTFHLGTGTNGYVIAAGSSKTFNVRIDSTKTATAGPGLSVTLGTTINTITDVLYTDGLDPAATTGIPLSQNFIMPMPINSVSYAQGT